MKFNPRTTAPSETNPYYIRKSAGGYNPCIAVYGKSCLPNCVGYAFGRFMECTGDRNCTLSTHDAYKWYGYRDGYNRGTSPKLGAVMCWTGGNIGHVAIVEGINSDGTLQVSESWYKKKRFNYAVAHKDKNGMYQLGWTAKKGYRFQGFIYNPQFEDTGGAGDTSSPSSKPTTPLYTSGNTKKDAIIREVGYLNSTTGQPSISSTDVKLSVINYTPVLGALSAILGYNSSNQASGDNTSLILDKVQPTPREIINVLHSRGLSYAACVGICGNVQAECGFNVSQQVRDSDGYLAGGMCMWNDHYKNLTHMKNYIAKNYPGTDWRSNLTAQCDYLYYDMTVQQASYFQSRIKKYYSSPLSLVSYLNNLPNTDVGAQDAAEVFMKIYENPGNWSAQAKKRRGYALNIWNTATTLQI